MNDPQKVIMPPAGPIRYPRIEVPRAQLLKSLELVRAQIEGRCPCGDPDCYGTDTGTDPRQRIENRR